MLIWRGRLRGKGWAVGAAGSPGVRREAFLRSAGSTRGSQMALAA
jgi:hypothetical protein